MILALPLALAGCFGGDGDRPSLMDGTQAGGPQPFPDNFRSDTLALMRAYLNNPVGVREAGMAEALRLAACSRLSRQPSSDIHQALASGDTGHS